jgi:hypothetical protein
MPHLWDHSVGVAPSLHVILAALTSHLCCEFIGNGHAVDVENGGVLEVSRRLLPSWSLGEESRYRNLSCFRDAEIM